MPKKFRSTGSLTLKKQSIYQINLFHIICKIKNRFMEIFAINALPQFFEQTNQLKFRNMNKNKLKIP